MAVKKLSKSQLEYYLQILQEERDRVIKSVNGISETIKMGTKELSGDASSFPLHLADLATDNENLDMNISFLNRELEKLKVINQAINRIHEKSYGICEICGEYIPEGRLRILPYASQCVICRSREEKKQRKVHNFREIE
ncbi:MAG: TraR/DksA family transcriptional regulator [Candidatus Cloacimonetes bacterium]|nr:TraR/DksA family transcriptional regulator [Candidatus Cloacimonadota bacterium]